MVHPDKRARSNSRVNWRKPSRDKAGRNVRDAAIRQTSALIHLKWCRYRRATAAIRASRRDAEKSLNQHPHYVRQVVTFVRSLQSSVNETAARLNSLERDLLGKTPLRRLYDFLGVPRSHTVSSVMQARLRMVIERRFHFALPWYHGAKRLWDMKCPFCGTHSVFRFCWVQTLRLFLIDLRHADSMLRSEGILREERVAVVVSLYGWSKFGSRAGLDIVSDVKRILSLCGVPISFGAVKLWYRLAEDLADGYFVLTGKKVTIPNLSDFTSAVQTQQSRRMGIDAHELVWNLWFALDRFTSLTVKGIALWVSSRELLDEAANLVASVQSKYFAQEKVPLFAEYCADLSNKELEAKPPWRGGGATDFKTFKESLEQVQLLKEMERKRGMPPPPPMPPMPPPPPPPRGVQRGLASYGPTPPLSLAERRVAYAADAEWPRCHPGWVCPNRDSHCSYLIPGMQPVTHQVLPSEVTAVLERHLWSERLLAIDEAIGLGNGPRFSSPLDADWIQVSGAIFASGGVRPGKWQWVRQSR